MSLRPVIVHAEAAVRTPRLDGNAARARDGDAPIHRDSRHVAARSGRRLACRIANPQAGRLWLRDGVVSDFKFVACRCARWSFMPRPRWGHRGSMGTRRAHAMVMRPFIGILGTSRRVAAGVSPAGSQTHRRDACGYATWAFGRV